MKELILTGKGLENRFEELLKGHNLTYKKQYEVITMVGLRKIDFVVFSRFGKVIVECKYRKPEGYNAAQRYAATDLFVLAYEYRKLFPTELMIAVVNDKRTVRPGKHNYVALLSDLGVEVVTISKEGDPDKFLKRRLEELSE